MDTVDDREKKPNTDCKENGILDEVYRACRALLGIETWCLAISRHPREKGPEYFSSTLENIHQDLNLPRFLPDLARLEWAAAQAKAKSLDIRKTVVSVEVSPTLTLLELQWKNLSSLLNGNRSGGVEPEPGEEMVLVWCDPLTEEVRMERASPETLLPLKITAEGIPVRDAAKLANTTISTIDSYVERAVKKGILVAPASQLTRGADFPRGENISEEFFTADVFTLQWHITQACDLHCKHCYDRSDRSPMKLDLAYRVLDDLYDFCRGRAVRGQVSFSGGNPFLYPHFAELYRAASERGFALAVLGNPSDRKKMEELLRIEKPVFFQVSLEGLEEHNDSIRGAGHFRRTLDFLGLLRDLRVYSMVMLTLTKDNMAQVIPLAETLRDSVDLFTFNRLSLFGEGANLMLPDREGYADFLMQYLEASKHNPVIAKKDNLLNILHYRNKTEVFGGCAGHGCGAAFNFLAVLPDGEVHACRKFPSLIGNIYENGLAEIYDSPDAGRYRKGCAECRSCPVRPVCGGCLAVASSVGLNVFEQRDPLCFFDGGTNS